MNTPLYDKLLQYSRSKLAFHMPGHKFGIAAELNNLSIIELDNTEAIGMDNLYDAQGIIKEAMELMANFYGSKETLFLTNGSTSGIIAGILSVCKDGDELIIARNSHHSVWSALILGGITPIYISPQYRPEDDMLGEISADIIEKALIDYPKAKGVLVVSPTYEGIVSDIKEISRVVHKYNKVLIVDEAHGAHFVLGKDFPLSSIHQGADLVINSMHKTLPALTQSGLLHICSERIRYDNVIESLRMIQTSSPSYMMMGLMDYIRSYILENKNKIQQQYVDELLVFRKELNDHLMVLRLLDMEKEKYDKSKIIISTIESNIDGYELADILNTRYDISVEAALETYVILMTTMADNSSNMTRLRIALEEIDKELEVGKSNKGINNFIVSDIIKGFSPRKIYYSDKAWVGIKDAITRKSAKNIMLYPPGIPLVCIGELIEQQHIDLIYYFKDKLQGIQLIDDEILIYTI